jgi:hypothetical protein
MGWGGSSCRSAACCVIRENRRFSWRWSEVSLLWLKWRGRKKTCEFRFARTNGEDRSACLWVFFCSYMQNMLWRTLLVLWWVVALVRTCPVLPQHGHLVSLPESKACSVQIERLGHVQENSFGHFPRAGGLSIPVLGVSLEAWFSSHSVSVVETSSGRGSKVHYWRADSMDFGEVELWRIIVWLTTTVFWQLLCKDEIHVGRIFIRDKTLIVVSVFLERVFEILLTRVELHGKHHS